jgi:hypothetical protein
MAHLLVVVGSDRFDYEPNTGQQQQSRAGEFMLYLLPRLTQVKWCARPMGYQGSDPAWIFSSD